MEESSDYLSLAGDEKIKSTLTSGERVVFSDDIFKYNRFNWKQRRKILITDRFLYNFKNKTLRRRINLINIAATTISEHIESDEFVIHVPDEYDYRYSSAK